MSEVGITAEMVLAALPEVGSENGLSGAEVAEVLKNQYPDVWPGYSGWKKTVWRRLKALERDGLAKRLSHEHRSSTGAREWVQD